MIWILARVPNRSSNKMISYRLHNYSKLNRLRALRNLVTKVKRQLNKSIKFNLKEEICFKNFLKHFVCVENKVCINGENCQGLTSLDQPNMHN